MAKSQIHNKVQIEKICCHRSRHADDAKFYCCFYTAKWVARMLAPKPKPKR